MKTHEDQVFKRRDSIQLLAAQYKYDWEKYQDVYRRELDIKKLWLLLFVWVVKTTVFFEGITEILETKIKQFILIDLWNNFDEIYKIRFLHRVILILQPTMNRAAICC